MVENYWTALAETISDVKSIELYEGGTIVIKREEAGTGNSLLRNGEKRGKVRFLSRRAMCRLLFVVAETTVNFASMMTLTYGRVYPRSGKDVKSDLNRLLTAMRTRYARAGQKAPSYLWFLEFQRRGAPHIHVLITVLPGDIMTRKDFAKMWRVAQKLEIRLREEGYEDREIAKEVKKVEAVHGHLRAWEAIRSERGATRYVAKYALKTKQKNIPTDFQDVGRFFGWSRDVAADIQPVAELSVTEDDLRELLEMNGHMVAGFDVLPKYVFGGLQSRQSEVSRET